MLYIKFRSLDSALSVQASNDMELGVYEVQRPIDSVYVVTDLPLGELYDHTQGDFPPVMQINEVS